MSTGKVECPLCRAEHITEWLYEDQICWIAICATCKVPLVVYRFHHEPAPIWQRHMEDKARELFPGCKFRYERRQIKEHWHCHLEVP